MLLIVVLGTLALSIKPLGEEFFFVQWFTIK
jgi:hypothetical protein